MVKNIFEKYSFIASLPGLICIKDINSQYIATTQGVADLVGWKSPHNSFGKTDYDLQCDAVKFADTFIKIDQEVVTSGLKKEIIAIQKYTSSCKILLGEVAPIKNEAGEVIALYNSCIDVTHIDFFRVHLLGDSLRDEIKPVYYPLSTPYCPFPLTDKQEMCLFFLVRGKTAKDIGKIMGISYRTVEYHIEALKTKFQCQNKSELIGTAIEKGFLSYIPEGLRIRINQNQSAF